MTGKRLKILVFISDMGGCFHYRCRIPLDSLMNYGVVWQPYSFLPSEVNNPDNFNALVNMISSFDLVIIQRCFLKTVCERLIQACRLLSLPILMETDDDYLSIIPSNPAYFAIVKDQRLFNQFVEMQQQAQHLLNGGKKIEADACIRRIQEMVPLLMKSREEGLEDYKWILRNVDGVTVSTRELAWTIYPYNKNVHVFENQVQFCYPWRLDAPEEAFIHEVNGVKQVQIQNRLGLYTVPKYAVVENTIRGMKAQEIRKTPRMIYTCTSSHLGPDFDTVSGGINKVAKKLFNKSWYIFLGDSPQAGSRLGPFGSQITSDPGRVLSLNGSEYNMYTQNILNGDYGIAPLASTTFNLAKSSVKALELGAARVAPLLPHIQTYLRDFKDNDTALFYRNENEFCEKMELFITNHRVREEIASNALKYVINNRLSWLPKNTEPRYDFYRNLVNSTPRLKIYKSAVASNA